MNESVYKKIKVYQPHEEIHPQITWSLRDCCNRDKSHGFVYFFLKSNLAELGRCSWHAESKPLEAAKRHMQFMLATYREMVWRDYGIELLPMP